MTTLWIIVALLVFIALLFFIILLFGKSKRQASSKEPEARDESARRLSGTHEEDEAPSSGRGLLIVALITVPALTIGLYLLLGKPEASRPQTAPAVAVDQGQGQAQGQGVTQAQIEAMVAGLEQKLKAKPGDVQGWSMLGRSYGVMGRYKDAVAAYQSALALEPQNAQLLVDYADVLAMAQGKKFTDETEKIIQQALKVDPVNLKALALAGSAAFQRKDYNAAINYWQLQLKLLPEGSGLVRSVQGGIAEAQRLSAQPAGNKAAAMDRGQQQPANDAKAK
jgi:cytochrome c-type biogenesis protein CcmH